ncbi:MAG: trehalose-phosphatase [Acidimicrobiales bacterium]
MSEVGGALPAKEGLSEEALVSWLAVQPGATALLLDFDGTIAEIVNDPLHARPLPEIPALLTDLADRMELVGVISGRPVDFLRGHLIDTLPVGTVEPVEPFKGSTTGAATGYSTRFAVGKLSKPLAGSPARPRTKLVMVGIYGLEMLINGLITRDKRAEEWEKRVDAAYQEAALELPSGVLLEDKGLGFALHWRQSPGSATEATEMAMRLADNHGLVLQPGKMAIELGPLVDIDKGNAIEKLVGSCQGSCQRTCYVGDDVGDIAAFDALDRMSRSGMCTMKVAVGGPEIPDALSKRADLVLDAPSATGRVLTLLLERLDS